jgi:hypothetical protein
MTMKNQKTLFPTIKVRKYSSTTSVLERIKLHITHVIDVLNIPLKSSLRKGRKNNRRMIL